MSKFRDPAKWKAEAPTRASTGFSIKKESISAPIPRIEDDDEFPIRTPGASIATPLGRTSLDRSIRFPAALPSPLRSTLNISEPVESGRPNKTPSQGSDHANGVIIPQSEPSALRRSIGSAHSHRSLEKPQRKKSTLRSVFGKIFGRKRKSISPPTLKEESQDLRAQHRSDPSALHNKSPSSNAQKRSASLPINEFNRALRSHSVVIEEFPLRESYEQRDSKAEGSFTRPRGATTPSRDRVWDQQRALGNSGWIGLSPRPASSHARGSKTDSNAEAREVGVALTSHNKAENRKSRSVGDLRDAMQQVVVRRRSDEIRYWRQSYEQGLLSPMSSNRPDVDEEPILVEEQAESDKENYEPPQPFNFGPMGEMAGMKITQAASLETRVLRLEERMSKMEKFIIGKHQPNTRPATGESENSLAKNKIHRGSPQRPIRQGPDNRFRSSSYGSSRPSTQNHIPAQPSFDNYPPPVFSTNHTKAPRPLSTSTTIRNAHAEPSPTTKDGALTLSHYNTLQTLITNEQTARLTLEELVHSLQQEVHTLRQSIAHHPAFSTFSRDDSDEDEEDERYDTDNFQTPMETPVVGGNNEQQRAFGDEIFGDVSGNRGIGYDRGGQTKTASRTLSLSQITQKSAVGVQF